jgi:hypothetical protein
MGGGGGGVKNRIERKTTKPKTKNADDLENTDKVS